MNGSLGGWENTRANLQPKEARPAGDPVPAAAPPGAGIRAEPARRGNDFGTRVDSAGGCAGVSRGGRARRAAAPPAALGGGEGLRAGAVASAARGLLRKRQTKDFASPLSVPALLHAGQQLPRCRRPRAAVAAGLCACPRRGFVLRCRLSPRAGRLPREDASPLRNRAAGGTHSAIGRAAGARRRAGHRGRGAPPPPAAPAVRGRRREPAGPRAPRRCVAAGKGPLSGSGAVPQPALTWRGGARLQHRRRVGCGGSGVLGEGRTAGTTEDGRGAIVPELLAPLKQLSSFRAGSSDTKSQANVGKGDCNTRLLSVAVSALPTRRRAVR